MAGTLRLLDRPTTDLSDAEVVARVAGGEKTLFELLMRRHNQKVYRALRGLLRDEAAVEDAMQQTYLQAYARLRQFEGSSQFSTWLVRIAINEGLQRLRARKPSVVPEAAEEEVVEDASHSPEQSAGDRELLGVLQSALDELPPMYASVFMLREVEGLSTGEAAESLGVSVDAVKQRLRRAKSLLREQLDRRLDAQVAGLFAFHAPRCDRVVAAVMARLSSL